MSVGYLNAARVYLSGPMYYGGEEHGEGEDGWRKRGMFRLFEAHPLG